MKSMIISLACSLALSVIISFPLANAEEREKRSVVTLSDLFVPRVEVILTPRVILPKGGIFEVTNGTQLSEGSRMTMVITVFAAKGTRVVVVRTCGALDSDGGKKKVGKSLVGASGLVLKNYELRPDTNGFCLLSVKVGKQETKFKVFGPK